MGKNLDRFFSMQKKADKSAAKRRELYAKKEWYNIRAIMR